MMRFDFFLCIGYYTRPVLCSIGERYTANLKHCTLLLSQSGPIPNLPRVIPMPFNCRHIILPVRLRII